MRLKKRLLSVALAAAMLFSLSTTAWAENGTTDGTVVQNVEGTVSTWESAEDDAANGQDAPAGDQQTGTETETVTGQEKSETQTIDPAQVPAPMSMVEEQDTEGAATDAVTTFEELQAAVEAAPKDGTETVIRLGANITAKSSLTVQRGQNVVLDFQGNKVLFAENFPAGRLFTNKGTLTLQGKGTVDARPAGGNGYGAVNNFGTLTVVDGTYYNTVASNASVIYNRSVGTLTLENPRIESGVGAVATEANTTTTIDGGYYFSQGYPTIENRGEMLITAGEFVNTSCSSCTSNWGYTVRSGVTGGENAHLTIQGAAEDSVKVTGVQGGLAVVGGTADIYNGVYKTVACQVHGDATAFYAGYFTGESYKTATNIYGGTFESASKTAILIGNSNPAPDSGKGEESTVMIYGGSFTGGDAAKTAITVDNTENAIGAATIYGGTFSSDPTPYLDEDFKMVQKSDGTYGVEALPAVAQVGTETYTSIAKAIEATETQAVDIKLLSDVNEDVVIPAGKSVTLDLAGHTLTNVKDHTITNNGTLIVNDSVGGGVVDNITHGKGAVYNNVGANATLNAGTYTRSKENGQSSSDNGGNSWYAIKNFGTMAINQNVTVKFDGAYSSLIANGWYNYATAVNGSSEPMPQDGTTAKLTIYGGTFSGGINTIKNDDNSELVIEGGTFENVVQHAVLNVDVATIKGGTFNVTGNTTEENLLVATVCNRAYNDSYDEGKLTITGGKFAAPAGKDCVVSQNQGEAPVTEISGGYFTSEIPQDYLAEGKACNLLDALYEGVYAYQVGESTAENVEVKVEMAQPEVDSTVTPEPAGSVTVQEVKDAAGNISIAQESEFDVLNAVKKEANLDGQPLDSETVKNLAIEALEEAADSKLQEDSVAIVVEPYLNIKPVSADDRAGSKQMTFDIELLYRVTATADKEDGGTVEATLQEGQKVQNPPQMDITLADVSAIAIPEESKDAVYVKHNHEGRIFYYMGEATCEADIVKSVAFTNLYGFSEFTVLTDTRYAEVKFPTTEQTFVYGPYSIGYTMPRPTMDGYTFNGWQFDGIEGTYTMVDEDLLTKLSDLYTKNGGKPIQAVAIFTQNPAQGGSTGGSGSSTTAPATPSAPAVGGSDVYYTCPACGYHDWTATSEGYRCNNCGYLESTKQLSGYSNVKGVYEPKSGAAAAPAAANAVNTSGVPQTSDDLPLTGLVVLAVAALLGLGVTVVLKKRGHNN